MFLKCNRCGTKPKIDWSFRVAKEDAVGFFFLSIVVGGAIGLITWVFTMMQFQVFGLILGGLSFLFVFYKIGTPVFSFLSYFVDYDFTLKITCESCGKIYKDYKIPAGENA